MRRACWKNAGVGVGEPSLTCSPCTPTTMRPGATSRGPPCGLIWTKPPPAHFAFQTPRLCPCFRPTPRHSPPVPPLRPSPRVLSAAVAVDRSFSQQWLPGLPDAAGLSCPNTASCCRSSASKAMLHSGARPMAVPMRQRGCAAPTWQARRPAIGWSTRRRILPAHRRCAAVPLCRCAA